MLKYKLSEIEINYIFAHKKLKTDLGVFKFNQEQISLLRKLFKKSKYYK